MVNDQISEIDEIRERLREVNLVSFSGGKDSTTVLQMVLSAMEGCDPNHKLYIVTADTLMEIPYFQEYVNATRDKIESYIAHTGINAKVVTVRPLARDSFWTSVLGKGYPAAHMGFRWCTGKLKIDPITKFTKTVTKGKDYSVFVGVRSSESPLRARIYKQKDYKPNHFAPILDWTSHDVWEFLLTVSCSWGGNHEHLTQVYRYSSDECVYGESQGVCVGNARYGCWACPLQSVSQLDMIGYNLKDDRYKKLKNFKTTLSSLANRSACRSRIRRNGSDGLGPFLVTIRKRLYEELKQTELKTGWSLITPEEESYIREHWIIDENVHNIPDPKQPLLWGVS